MLRKKIFLLIMLLALIGCDQKAFFGKFIPKDEFEFSKQFLALFQSRDFDAMERKISPDLNDAQLRQTLEEMAALFPNEQAKNISFVGSHTYTDQNVRRVNLSLQYEFPSKWLFANIIIEKKGDLLVVKGIHVQPLQDSLEKINRFTFQGQGAIHYIFLSLAIMVGLFIIFALVLCIRTPIPKRKWLWIIFVLFGFFRVTLNWTTGVLNITPVSFQMLGLAISKQGLYAPWLVQVSVPLGAIIFLLKRKKWLAPQVELEANDTQQPSAESGD